MHQGAAKAGDEADRLDGCLAALAMQALHRQRPIGEDMQPVVLAVDPQAGFVGMQGRRGQQVGGGGGFPSLQGLIQAADVAEAGGLGQAQAGERLDQFDGPAQGEHMGH